ncbi:MAG TPA: CsbD family protein [Chloroflexota bacterium]|nr:CsbD family protein [Chloroflexota bacterium]
MGDRIDEMKGDVKEGWGKLTGNERVEAEGRAEADKAKAMRETKGAVQQAGGSVKEGLGQLTGDERLEAEGKADRLGGEAKRAG